MKSIWLQNFTGCEEKLIPLGFNLHPIVFDKGLKLNKNIKVFFSNIFLNKKNKPDIVHSITLKPIIFGGFAAKILTNVAFVASVSDWDTFISSDLRALILKFFAKFFIKIAFSKENLKLFFKIMKT